MDFHFLVCTNKIYLYVGSTPNSICDPECVKVCVCVCVNIIKRNAGK